MDGFQEIKRAIDRMDSATAKSCLSLAMGQIRFLKERKEQADRALAGLIDLYDQLMTFDEHKTNREPHPECTHVHIAMGDSFAGSLKLALRNLGWAETHAILSLDEDYAIGPLAGLDKPEGRQRRQEWFQNNIADAFEIYMDFEEEHNNLLRQLNQIPEQADVILWAGRSVREQVGLRHALHLLRHAPNTIHVCDPCAICEARFNRPGASIEYRRSGEIPPDKLQEALKDVFAGTEVSGSQLSADDAARLSGEWQTVSEQGGVLRIWENDAVVEVPADYFDAYLLEKLDDLTPPAGDGGFVKAARLVGEALGHCEQDIGHAYFEYRMRELVYQGVLEIKGVPAGMRYYSVRRKGYR